MSADSARSWPPKRRFQTPPATTPQGDLFDLQKGLYAKDVGVQLVVDHGEDWQAVMQSVAKAICNAKGEVCSDDLRRYAATHDLEPHHPNAWGAVFRGNGWKHVGWKRSAKITNHARTIRVWTWKGE